MRESERGFTLVEMVVVVSITAIVLAAGAVWMLSMRPAALRHAVDEYDAALAEARAVAANSGNGATMVFAPATGGGFTIRVYSGRPTAANAVTATNTFEVISHASVREATYGAPPFALFFSSAGYATGKAAYPSFDSSGNATFATIAQQPSCPANGISLMFTSVQGATDTRTLTCSGVSAAGVNVANPSPTPGAVHISTQSMVAHWTTDTNGALKFVVGEFGYKHWYAKGTTSCDSLVTFKGPNPYNSPTDANEANLAPSAPANTPISYPSTTFDPDEPRAPFELLPISGTPGECTMTIVDDTGQSVQTNVRVMGDLTPNVTSLSFNAGDPAKAVQLSKTWDNEALSLTVGGACGGVVTTSVQGGVTPSSPGAAAATASIQVTPVNGSLTHCILEVGDQYGEPHVFIPINVTNQPFATWPASLTLGTNGAAIGVETNAPVTIAARNNFGLNSGAILNELLGGAVAFAASSYSGPCYAYARASSGSGVDTTLPAGVAQALGVSMTSDGCILNADGTAPYDGSTGGTSGTPTGAIITYEPNGQSGNFQPTTTSCANYVTFGSWYPNLGRNEAQAALPAVGGTSGSCIVNFSDGISTRPSEPDGGQVSVNVLDPDPCEQSGNLCLAITTDYTYTGDTTLGDTCPGPGSCNNRGTTLASADDLQDWYYVSSDGAQSWSLIGYDRAVSIGDYSKSTGITTNWYSEESTGTWCTAYWQTAQTNKPTTTHAGTCQAAPSPITYQWTDFDSERDSLLSPGIPSPDPGSPYSHWSANGAPSSTSGVPNLPSGLLQQPNRNDLKVGCPPVSTYYPVPSC